MSGLPSAGCLLLVLLFIPTVSHAWSSSHLEPTHVRMHVIVITIVWAGLMIGAVGI